MLTKSEPGSHPQRVASVPPRLVSAMRTTTRPCRLNLGLPRAASSCTRVKIDICPSQRSITRECQNNNGNDEKTTNYASVHWEAEWLEMTNSEPLPTDTPTSTFFYFFHSFTFFFDTILFGFLAWVNLACLSCRFSFHIRLIYHDLSCIRVWNSLP